MSHGRNKRTKKIKFNENTTTLRVQTKQSQGLCNDLDSVHRRKMLRKASRKPNNLHSET